MALSRTNLLGAFAGTNGSNFGTGNYTSAAFTPPSSSLLVVAAVFVQNSGTTDPTSAFQISDSGGHTWTQAVTTVVSPTSFPTCVKIWYTQITTGASTTVTLTTAGRPSISYAVSVVAYTGYDTTTPVGATATGTQNGGFTGPPDPVTITLSGAPASTSEVIAAVGMNKSAASATEGSGWTELHDVTNTAGCSLESEARTGSTSTSVQWADLRSGGGALFNFAAVAAEIKEASGGSAVTVTDVTTGVAVGGATESVLAGVVVADVATGVAVGAPSETVLVGLTVADTPTGTAVGGSSEAVLVGVTATDAPTGVAVGGATETVFFDVVTLDSPTGIALGGAVETVTASGPGPVDVTVVDDPTGVAVGGAVEAVTSGVLILDTPTGAAVGGSSSSVAIDVVVQDLPGGIAVGGSVEAVLQPVVIIVDVSTGIAVGGRQETVVLGPTHAPIPDVIAEAYVHRASGSLTAAQVIAEVYIART